MNEPVVPSPLRAAEAPAGLVILGHPVAQSLSPIFQQAALDACGLPQRYERCDAAPAELDAALEALHAARIGGNATLPHKEAMHARAGRLTPMAARAGAVNTFWWEGSTLVGHNTDVDGVTATLHALCPGPLDSDIVVLGAGGAAAAVLIALSDHPAIAGLPLHMVARSPWRAHSLIERVGVTAAVHTDAQLAPAFWRRVSMVINTTPVGMRSADMPMDPAVLPERAVVFDLVYRPGGTAWVHRAIAHGLRAEDGLRMLVEQGASAFDCWFGRTAPRATMWEALGEQRPPADDVRPIATPNAPSGGPE